MKMLVFLAVFSSFAWSENREGFNWAPLESLAIQDRGRIKPFHTFAEESVQFVTGSRRFKEQPAVETVLSWLLEAEPQWERTAFIRVSYGPLKKRLGLSLEKKFFSPEEIRSNAVLRALAREVGQKSQRKEKLNDLDSRVVTLQNQMGLLDFISSGGGLAIFPNPQGMELPWAGVDGIADASRLPYTDPQKAKLDQVVKGVFSGFLKADSVLWNAFITQLSDFVRGELSLGYYPAQSELSREVHFNKLRPFRWAWVAYVGAFLAMLIHSGMGTNLAGRVGVGALALGLFFHTYGFVLRCWISGRPPVTNMYESVIWVSWGCLIFSILIGGRYCSLVIPTAATVFSTLALVLADNLPTVLDSGIHPLEPVLRSNFWLTTHVLCITLSYSAFALSLCLGNLVLGNFIFRPERTLWIQNLSLYMYRAMQIGVILVAAGTILGGVWADYSWGRFWGWDPKEVWALIVLLMYVAVLHGRFTGWLQGFGFVTATIFCFLSVLMAWYGVNFVLGVGLHSYGFGSGGLGYVSGYVILQVVVVVVAWIRYRKLGSGAAIFPKGIQ